MLAAQEEHKKDPKLYFHVLDQALKRGEGTKDIPPLMATVERRFEAFVERRPHGLERHGVDRNGVVYTFWVVVRGRTIEY